MKIKLKNIIKAKHDFGHFINTTPLVYSERLSKKYEANIYLKREDLQPVRSYKIRGAFNLINSLNEKEKNAGVVCASAGNHAQGVAITCNHLKIKGTIFMPVTTPEQKVYKTKQFGGKYIEVILIGDTFDEAFKASKEFEEKNNSTFVHPFDDERIITGQATIGLEIYDEMEIDPDYIICPIGGGGVVSGIISITKDLDKKTKVIGVEPEGALSMKKSLEKGKNTQLEKINIFIDGASVARVGDKTFQIAKDYDLKVISCPENRVCSTILEYLKEDGIVVEPAGALSTDALKDLKKEIKGKNVVLIISGGNFDFERLQEVKERSMKYEGLKRYFIVSFPQRPGALKDFLGCLGPNDDIARFEYLKKSNKNTAPVFIGIETDSKENWSKITSDMEKLGFKYHDVTNDELYFDLLV
ncbi:MAG: threonine ammonia-lyase IlvA [Candidatus Gracilibacteria bacterium]|nr:threonine ammonia-lyase IlvA [Candidatus Gracilibacteria bacterium]